MHLVFNANTGDKSFIWCDLIFKGIDKRILEAEKERRDKSVDLFWQNKAWVVSVVIRDLDQNSVAHNNEVHGEGFWVIVFCDNLSAHLGYEVKQIFESNKVFL